ncbi:hypothetical protein ACIOYV_07890 [Pseudomonas sp. NPDC087342]|uniref:hypothetical protein n=1 Tax=Pseudomonas sp. NPDC087342 TaxID=3364437 RepID=UPI00382E17A8
MELYDMVQTCFSQGLDGEATDEFVQRIGVNALKRGKPVFSIEMGSKEELLTMMQSADDVHVFIENGVFHINAMYNFTDKFPAPRIYLIKTQNMMTFASTGVHCQEHGIHLLPIDGKEFSRRIQLKGYTQRFDRWHKRWKANSKVFDGLLDGRLENTAIEQGIWLNSDGNCLVCGEKAEQMSTATLIGNTGLMIGMQLCNEHATQAQNHSSLINYLAEKMGVPAPLLADATVVNPQQSNLEATCELLQQDLACTVEKIDQQTITAIRPSGFRLILRQDALHNYAYNIKDPTGKLVSRIDSADHHAVQYGPAHVHRNLSKSKKNHVESSFTYGVATADLKAIRRLVEDAESVWLNAQA